MLEKPIYCLLNCTRGSILLKCSNLSLLSKKYKDKELKGESQVKKYSFYMITKLEKMIKKVKSLNEVVSIPPKLPDNSQIKLLEKESGLIFHPDFKYFLMNASNLTYGVIEPVTAYPDSGHTYFLEVLIDARANGISTNDIPICEDNGNYYCVQENGEVVFWDHNGGPKDSWKSIADWIEKVWLKNC